jgi:MoaD family protein
MVVSIRLYAHVRAKVGKEDLQLNLAKGATVQAALRRVMDKYGKELVEMLGGRNLVIMLNDKNIEFLGGLKTRLEQGDRIAILPPLSGG